MQDRDPSSLGSIWSEDTVHGRSPEQPAELWDLSGNNHDAMLLLREPHGDRIQTTAFAGAALVAIFALGWAGGLNWRDFVSPSSIVPAVQKEASLPRVADPRPSVRSEGSKRSAAASEPAVTGSIPKSSASPRLPVLAAPPTTLNAQAMALATKQPLVAAPETRPSTIPGWSVVEVRDGTAVLEGTEGVRMAARGDVIPGLGRVDSIVRWGSRWIVATASGLIATP
jgi:hypothetical protein